MGVCSDLSPEHTDEVVRPSLVSPAETSRHIQWLSRTGDFFLVASLALSFMCGSFFSNFCFEFLFDFQFMLFVLFCFSLFTMVID